MLLLGFWSSFSSKNFISRWVRRIISYYLLCWKEKNINRLPSISFKYGLIWLLISVPLWGTWTWLFDILGLLSSFVIFVHCSPRSLKDFSFRQEIFFLWIYNPLKIQEQNDHFFSFIVKKSNCSSFCLTFFFVTQIEFILWHEEINTLVFLFSII